MCSTVIDSLKLSRNRTVSSMFEKYRERARFAGHENPWVGIPVAASKHSPLYGGTASAGSHKTEGSQTTLQCSEHMVTRSMGTTQ